MYIFCNVCSEGTRRRAGSSLYNAQRQFLKHHRHGPQSRRGKDASGHILERGSDNWIASLLLQPLNQPSLGLKIVSSHSLIIAESQHIMKVLLLSPTQASCLPLVSDTAPPLRGHSEVEIHPTLTSAISKFLLTRCHEELHAFQIDLHTLL